MQPPFYNKCVPRPVLQLPIMLISEARSLPMCPLLKLGHCDQHHKLVAKPALAHVKTPTKVRSPAAKCKTAKAHLGNPSSMNIHALTHCCSIPYMHPVIQMTVLLFKIVHNHIPPCLQSARRYLSSSQGTHPEAANHAYIKNHNTSHLEILLPAYASYAM